MPKIINEKTNGYIALMSTITIGAILLTITIGMSEIGWTTRFLILGTENKAQSLTLAHSCADLAVAKIMTDPAYLGNSTTTLASGTCYIFPLILNTPTPNTLTIRVRGVVKQTTTSIEKQYDMSDVYLSEIALPSNLPIEINNFSVTPLTWREYSTMP